MNIKTLDCVVSFTRDGNFFIIIEIYVVLMSHTYLLGQFKEKKTTSQIPVKQKMYFFK